MSSSAALDRPGVRKTTATAPRDSLQHRCSVFLDLAESYFTVKDTKKGLEMLGEADVQFRGTSQAPRVILARAENLIAAGSSQPTVVIELLQTVGMDVPDFYYLAQEKLAGFYLKLGMQKEFIVQHERLFVQMGETPAAAVLLGNAYLKVPMVQYTCLSVLLSFRSFCGIC